LVLQFTSHSVPDFAGVLGAAIDFAGAVFFAAVFLVVPFFLVGAAFFVVVFGASARLNAHRFPWRLVRPSNG
jgi:hypothetical protein